MLMPAAERYSIARQDSKKADFFAARAARRAIAESPRRAYPATVELPARFDSRGAGRWLAADAYAILHGPIRRYSCFMSSRPAYLHESPRLSRGQHLLAIAASDIFAG